MDLRFAGECQRLGRVRAAIKESLRPSTDCLRPTGDVACAGCVDCRPNVPLSCWRWVAAAKPLQACANQLQRDVRASGHEVQSGQLTAAACLTKQHRPCHGDQHFVGALRWPRLRGPDASRYGSRKRWSGSKAQRLLGGKCITTPDVGCCADFAGIRATVSTPRSGQATDGAPR